LPTRSFNGFMRRSLLFLGIASWVVAASGCGDDGDRIQVYPVEGKVLVNGQPAQGATVALYPTSSALAEARLPPPTGTVDANGEFRLTSYESNDGAPAGEFQVTIVWPEPPPPNPVGVFEQKDRLRGRYANPQTSKLTATVEAGGGELPPFELQ
jgi:hypothetical protein